MSASHNKFWKFKAAGDHVCENSFVWKALPRVEEKWAHYIKEKNTWLCSPLIKSDTYTHTQTRTQIGCGWAHSSESLNRHTVTVLLGVNHDCLPQSLQRQRSWRTSVLILESVWENSSLYCVTSQLGGDESKWLNHRRIVSVQRRDVWRHLNIAFIKLEAVPWNVYISTHIKKRVQEPHSAAMIHSLFPLRK